MKNSPPIIDSAFPNLNSTIVLDSARETPSDKSKYNTYVRIKPKPVQPVAVSQNQQWPNEFIGNDDRQSLTNFEEFEKSMSMCQNEKDFEQMLNNISCSDSRSGDIMRQSLDHIKKRHSLMNLEKQLEDQRRSCADTNRTITHNPTAMDRTFGANLSTSGSGERLLRRSRVCDELAEVSSNSTETSNVDPNKTKTLNILNQSLDQTQNASSVVANPTLPVSKVGTPNRDRDRFKTIRISKPTPELPVVHITTNIGSIDDIHPVERESPPKTANPTLADGLMVPRRQLLRPSLLKGIPRRDASLGIPRNNALPTMTRVGNVVTSPMRSKAKSIHNLTTGYERSIEKSADEINAANHKEVCVNTPSFLFLNTQSLIM